MMTTMAFQTSAISTPLVELTAIKMARMTLARPIRMVMALLILATQMTTVTTFPMNAT